MLKRKPLAKTKNAFNTPADCTSCAEGPVKTSFSWRDDTWVRPYLTRYKKALLLALFLGVLTIGFASALMFTAGWLIGGSAEMPYSILLLGTPLLCVRIFGVGKPVLQYAERLTSHDWVLHMTSNLRVKLYRVFDSQGIFFRSHYRLGDALGLLAEDIGHIQNLYLRTIFPTVIAWILGVCLIAFFGCMTWWMGIIVALLLIVELLLVPLVSVLINGARQARHKALKASIYRKITDNVLGITDWVLSGRRDDYLHHSEQIQHELRNLEHLGHSFDKKRDLILQAFFALGACAVLAWAALAFSGQVGGQANWVLAFALGYFPLIDAFAPLSAAATEARAHRDSIERLNQLPTVEDDEESELEYESEDGRETNDPVVSKATDPTTSDNTLTASTAAGSTSSSLVPDIVLDHVTFSYPESQRLLLNELSLCIPAKQKAAILGKSGTGKSTLASLIRGDLAPVNGSVTLVDRRDQTHVAPLETSKLGNAAPKFFGVIQQRTYVFNTTLRDNLLIGNPTATDDMLINALHRVGLDALFRRLPKGLDTIVDEAGLGFSGGERHRIALARVLLQDAPIVILDEPMVGLDPTTEHQVLESVFEVLEDKTIIMITHHLQGISHMDRVLFIQDGRLELDGHPKQLERDNPYFQKLLALDRPTYLPLHPQLDQYAR